MQQAFSANSVITMINQSINKFITPHSTEARATMSLSQTEKECLNSVLENVNGWSRQLSGRELQTLGAATDNIHRYVKETCVVTFVSGVFTCISYFILIVNTF